MSQPEVASVILKPRRARPFFARHPWLFADSIGRIDGSPEPGAEVRVESHEGRFIARGLFNPHSAIRVRLHHWADEPLNAEYFRSKLTASVALRHRLIATGQISPEAHRLVASEGDGISGLTVDRYADWLVLQVTSLGLISRLPQIAEILREQTGLSRGWLRIPHTIARQEGLDATNAPIAGVQPPEAPLTIHEHDLNYRVDIRSGQKTGFYLDQRDNRLAAARYARDRKVLDLFCYSGGFSLTALKHGQAKSSLGIDSSSPAIDLARTNALTNRLAQAQFESGKVLETLGTLADQDRTFGLIICDPPKFASKSDALRDALKGYIKLNRAALDVLEPGGILATGSCTGLVDRSLFQQVLGQVAEQSGRAIRLLEGRGQPPDHPVSASCLESEYLKFLICQVD